MFSQFQLQQNVRKNIYPFLKELHKMLTNIIQIVTIIIIQYN